MPDDFTHEWGTPREQKGYQHLGSLKNYVPINHLTPIRATETYRFYSV